MVRRDKIRALLPVDDSDLVPFGVAQHATGLGFQEILRAIFAGQVLGGPDRAGDLRVSLSELLALHPDEVGAAPQP